MSYICAARLQPVARNRPSAENLTQQTTLNGDQPNDITTGKAWAHAPLMAEGKLQSDVEDTRYVWVEERGPILATLAVLGRPRIWVDVVRMGRRCCGVKKTQ